MSNKKQKTKMDWKKLVVLIKSQCLRGRTRETAEILDLIEQEQLRRIGKTDV